MDDEDEAWVEDEGSVIEKLELALESPSYTEQFLVKAKQFFVPYLMGLDGFVFVALLVAFFFFYQKVIKPYVFDVGEQLRQWRSSLRERAEDARLKKDPDLCRVRMEAIMAARTMQQEIHDAKVRHFAEKEELRRQEKLNRGAEESLKSGSAEAPSQKKLPASSLKSDFNPLMGSGGVCYRPVGRGSSSGGG